jgi:amino-acid N-acetyltransferase
MSGPDAFEPLSQPLAALKASDFVAVMRAAAPYVHAHNGRTFVIAFGGEVATRGDFERLLYDIALLHSLGVNVVIVHGARPQIERKLAQAGLTSQFAHGLRVTNPATMTCVKAAVGELRMDIEAILSTALDNTPMGSARIKLAGGNWITARPSGVIDGIDHQLTGEVRRIDIATIREVLSQGRMPLLSPIGYSPTGEIFNLRWAEVAQAVAIGLGADKLIFVLEADPRSWRWFSASPLDAGQLNLTQATALLADAPRHHTISPTDAALFEPALAACRDGVRRVHLIGAEPIGALLRELYSRDGCGLMFYAGDDYDSTRQAGVEDVGGIVSLIKPLENAKVLVARSRDQLEREISRFTVMVRDGTVIACSALFPYPESSTGPAAGELACVAVHPDYRGAGRAAALLAAAEEQARGLGLARIFVLTTHTPHWFVEHGFEPGGPEDLPDQRQSLYNYQRNSLVLVKKL